MWGAATEKKEAPVVIADAPTNLEMCGSMTSKGEALEEGRGHG